MNIVTQLMALPGVIAVGAFNNRGEYLTYAGLLDTQQVRLAAIMCNANSLAIQMQAGILKSLIGDGGLTPVRGWIVQGSHFTVCVVGNWFCFLEHQTASVNQIIALMSSDEKTVI